MKKQIIIGSLLAVTATGLFYGFNRMQAAAETVSDEDQVVTMPDLKNWPEASRQAAKEMEAKYGKPNGVTSDMLVWNNNGIWLKTIVYKKEMKHDFPKPHTDVMEQWINYSVPLNNYDDLALYDGSVTANRTNGTISARCDKEGMNLLALNLAYDIVNNSKTVDQARMDYGKNAMSFMKGEKPGYTQKLNFVSDKTAPDPDKPLDMDMQHKLDMGAE
jgi:hypothetical protein